MMEELDEDIRDHIVRETQENIERGMSPEEARMAAMRKFGNVTRVKEETRKVWRFVSLEDLLQDVKYALRMLRRTPGFTAVAVLTLALGIGANTAIFSVVNSMFLAPLPFKDASQLVNIHAHASFFDFWNLGLSLPDVNDIRAQSKSFSVVVPFQYNTVDLTGRDTPLQLDAAKVPPDFFSLLGLRPVQGRTFLPSEMQEGADQEAILSGRLWREQFGADARVVGANITLDGKSYQVVGVMQDLPKKEYSPAFMDIWTPFAPTKLQLTNRGLHGIPTLARLLPGVTAEQAQAELDGIAARLAKAYPKDDKEWSFRVNPLRKDMGRDAREPLLLLLGAVGFVLLIACANVGNLFLSRGFVRRRELAIRSTLGATRGRLVRQLLVESMLLAGVGGVLGLLFSVWGIAALKALLPAQMQLFTVAPIGINTGVLLFTLGVSILAGLLFGLAPAFLSSRQNWNATMKEGGAGARAGASSSGHNPLRQLLVVAEIALALVLVIGATLALRSFSRLLRVDVGFDTERVLDLRLDFPEAKFKNADAMFVYVRQMTERLGATPGVESASVAGNAPLSGAHGEGTFSIEGGDPNANLRASEESVGPRYFETLRIPLLRGRDFVAADGGNGAPVVVVNQAFAAKFFGGGNPIGKRLEQGEDAQHHPLYWEIVGEVGNVRDLNPQKKPDPEIYTPFYSNGVMEGLLTGAEFILRSHANPTALVSAAQQQVWAVDKDQPIAKVETMEQRVTESEAPPRVVSYLLGAFGALGLVLAVVGIYGVISYSVTQRTHEIGIRMALGAEPQKVMRLILGHGLKLALIGVVIGIGAALGLTRLMSSLLFDVSATDPATFVGVAILLVVVALAACWMPARRAMKVDPMEALRYE